MFFFVLFWYFLSSYFLVFPFSSSFSSIFFCWSLFVLNIFFEIELSPVQMFDSNCSHPKLVHLVTLSFDNIFTTYNVEHVVNFVNEGNMCIISSIPRWMIMSHTPSRGICVYDPLFPDRGLCVKLHPGGICLYDSPFPDRDSCVTVTLHLGGICLNYPPLPAGD